MQVKSENVKKSNVKKIKKFLPNRLKFLDDLSLDIYPMLPRN